MKELEMPVALSYQYDQAFFDAQSTGSLMSARAVVPLVQSCLRPLSVLDVGCGVGPWVAAWRDAGIGDVQGVDGEYVNDAQLLFDSSLFHRIDITKTFRLARRFDLVQCLEVAEHLPHAASATLVANLTAHAPIVLFSAAPPGQGGEHHINEQPPGFWRDLFREHGYELFDFFRKRLKDRPGIEPWYRYNMLLFARRDAIGGLPAVVKAAYVAPDQEVSDVSPSIYRARKWVLSRLPPRVVTGIARTKNRLVLAAAGTRVGLA
ncbi:MAG: methyltransferase domain-containing protein [Frateuria sp.]|nr:methyltransferase domain-containing protein [Frateuria sp.]